MAKFAVVRWLNDKNKLSVHNQKFFLDKKSTYVQGDEGSAVFPGHPGEWTFRILAVGEKKEMTTWLEKNFNRLTVDVTDKDIIKGNSSMSEKEQGSSSGSECKEHQSAAPVFIQSTPSKPVLEVSIDYTNLKLEHKIEGWPLPRVQWLKDGIPLSTMPDLYHVETTNIIVEQYKYQVTTSLTFAGSTRRDHTRLRIEDTGNYKCQVMSPAVQMPEERTTQLSIQSSMNLLTKSSPLPVGKPHQAERDHVTMKEFKELQDQFRKLKRRVKELESSSQTSSETSQPNSPKIKVTEAIVEESHRSMSYNGFSEDQLHNMICHIDSVYEACEKLLLTLFSTEYMLSHSITGRRANTHTEAKPKMDERLYACFLKVMKAKFPECKETEITTKVQAVQKKCKKMNS